MSHTPVTDAFSAYSNARNAYDNECRLAAMNWGASNWTRRRHEVVLDTEVALLQAFSPVGRLYAPLNLTAQEIASRRQGYLDFIDRALASGSLDQQTYDNCLALIGEVV